jgi:hypothetical protein
MRKAWILLLLVVPAGFTPVLKSSGQDASVPERIYFSALNKEEKPVMGLKPADFELRIDGKPAPLLSFHPALSSDDRSTPFAVLIMLAFDPAMDPKVFQQQANAAAHLFQMLNPASVVGIKMVSDRSETLAPLSSDPSALKNAMLQYRQRHAELNVGLKKGDVIVGNAGMVGALEYAIDEIENHIVSQAALRKREVRRAIMIISGGDLNPRFSPKILYEKAARAGVFLYPVYYPIVRRTAGGFNTFIVSYFQLAKETAGVASVFGAVETRFNMVLLPASNLNPNTLTTNFLHMIQDVNGKYSFTVLPTPPGRSVRLELKCKAKGVKLRVPRTVLKK